MAVASAVTNPGRPHLLLLITAGMLCAVLGLAYGQVALLRALGPEVPIPETPLVVRAPRGWVQSPQDRGVFAQVREGRSLFGTQWRVERKIRFRWVRLPAPISAIAAAKMLRLRVDDSETAAIRIGGLEGIEFRAAPGRRGFFTRGGEVRPIIRLAVTPRGDAILLEYTPLEDFTLSDVTLLDDICRAVRVVDGDIGVTAVQAMAHAGVRFDADRRWIFDLPRVRPAPGFAMADRGGGWSLQFQRTWLREGRTLDDLLRDAAAQQWRVDSTTMNLKTEMRRSGRSGRPLRVLSIDAPLAADSGRIRRISGVSGDATQAAIALLFADESATAAGAEAVERLVASLEMSPVALFADLDEAARRGREGIGGLSAEYLKRRWGSEPRRIAYRWTTGVLDFDAQTGRQLEPGTNAQWRQTDLWVYGGQRVYQSTTRYDSESRAFRMEIVDNTGAEPIEIREVSDGQEVSRAIRGANPRETQFRLGEGFVAPPVEQALAAHCDEAGDGAYLYETSMPWGKSTCFVLIVPKADEKGRLLRLVDYLPTGELLKFGSDGEVIEQEQSEAQMRRVGEW